MALSTYAVFVWDDEAGHWRQRSKVRGASAKAVERAYLAKHPHFDADDIDVKKAAPKPRKTANPSARKKTMKRRPASRRPKSRKVANPRGTPRDADSLYRIRREPLDSGGYTKGRFGKYFGRGEPLFAVETPDGDVLHVRGADRQDAMRNFRSEYKYRKPEYAQARFFGERRAGSAKTPAIVESGFVSLDGNMSPATQARLKALVKSRAPAQYPIEAHENSGDAKILRRRRVEASGRGEYGKNRYVISKTRLPALLIAMVRSGKDEEYDLASSILSTLDVELI